MKLLRRLTGMVLMLVGAVGIILASVTIYGVHQAATSVSKQAADILDSTKEAVVFLNRGTTKTQGLLGETKARVHGLDATLDHLASDT